MFASFKTKSDKIKANADEALRAAVAANLEAEGVVDPLVTKVVLSRYTVIYIVLAGVIAFAVGFSLGGAI